MHPVLTWHISNAVVEQDAAGNRKLNKKRSSEKIDGVVALAQAMGLYARQKSPAPAFDPDGIMVLSW